LQVPASRVALEGSTLTGMAFSLFDGRATWDNAGKFSGTFADSSAANPELRIVSKGRMWCYPGQRASAISFWKAQRVSI